MPGTNYPKRMRSDEAVEEKIFSHPKRFKEYDRLETLRLQAEAEEKLEKYKQAGDTWNQLANLTREASDWEKTANCRFKQGDVKSELYAWDQAYKMRGGNDLLEKVADVADRHGESERAADCWYQLANKTQYFQHWVRVAKAYESFHPRRARMAWINAAKIGGSTNVGDWLQAAKAYSEDGQQKDASHCFTQALAVNASSKGNDLIFEYCTDEADYHMILKHALPKKQFSLAATCSQKLAELASEDSVKFDYLKMAGENYKASNQYEAAYHSFLAATELKDEPEIWRETARCYCNTENPKDASLNWYILKAQDLPKDLFPEKDLYTFLKYTLFGEPARAGKTVESNSDLLTTQAIEASTKSY